MSAEEPVPASPKDAHRLRIPSVRSLSHLFHANLQVQILWWPAQAFILCLVLAHCASYFAYYVDDAEEEAGEERPDDYQSIILWQWSTATIILCFFVAEMLIRVAAQSGPICRYNSWLGKKGFLVPWMHKLELLAFLGVCYRMGLTLNTTIEWKSNEEQQEDNETSRLTAGFLILYRVLRFMTDKMGVSVSSVEAKRKELHLENRVWMQDIDKKQAEHGRYMTVKMQRVVNLYIVQVVVVVLVISQTFCYSYPLARKESSDFQTKLYDVSTPLAYLLILIFSLELMLRYLAQGGEAFFTPFLNKIEVVLLIAGLFWLFYEAWYSTAIRTGDSDRFHPSGVGVASILLTHRIVRALGIHFNISGDSFTSNSVTGARTAQFFMDKFGHALEIAPANVHVGVTDAWILKAKLKPEAFEDLHLPMKIRDGLIEELYIDFPDPLKPHLVLRMQNLLVLLSPGNGLAEAGGLSESGTYWNYETVLEAKARLVELICKNVKPTAKPKAKAAPKPEPSKKELNRTGTTSSSAPLSMGVSTLATNMKYHAANVVKTAKERITSFGKQFVRRVEVHISNVTLQYEDEEGELGQRQVRIGSRIGSAWVHFEGGSFLKCDFARIGFYIEPIINSDADSNEKFDRNYWKEPLAFLMNKHPKHALRELKRFNSTERVRMWAFDALDFPLEGSEHHRKGRKPAGDMQRFWRTERWPESRYVFSILTLQVRAGTASGLQYLEEREQELKTSPSKREPEKRTNMREHLVGLARLSLPGPKSEKVGTEDKPSSAESERWTWYVNTGRSKTPVSVNIDYDQVQCLHTILDCVKSWNILDNSFRWRPDMSFSDELTREALGIEEAHLDERRGLARQWWIYAIHRVLARRKIRPRIPWLDVVWQSHNAFRYRLLLRETGAQKAQKKAEERSLKELQVRLPLVSIIACHKNTQPAPSSEERQFSTRVIEVKSGISERLKRIKRTHPGLFSSQSPADSGSAAEPQAEHPSEKLVRTMTGDHLFAHEDEPSVESTMSAAPTDSMLQPIGKWILFLPCFEVRVLCPSPPPRPVVLHAKWSNIAGDIVFGSQAQRARAEIAEQEDLTFALTVTVEDFGVVCPQANELLLGGSRDMMTVVRHLRLPPLAPGSKFAVGHRQDKGLAFAFRAFAQPKGKSGEAEMHVPDMRIVMYEPLVLQLKKFTKKADENSVFSPSCLEEDRRAAFVLRRPGQKISQVVSNDGGGGMRIKTGRMGPFSTSLIAALTEAADQSAGELLEWATDHSDHIQHVREVRRLVKKAAAFRRKFELLSGFGGAIKEWSLSYYSGAVHGFQVGEYSDDVLLVEEYRMRNFVSDTSGAATEFEGRKSVASKPKRLVNWDFNGYSDRVLPSWTDEQWHELREVQVDSISRRRSNEEKVGLLSRTTSASSFFSSPFGVSIPNSFPPRVASRWECWCSLAKLTGSAKPVEKLNDDSGEYALPPSSDPPVNFDWNMASEESISRRRPGSMTVVLQGVRRDVFAKKWLIKEDVRWRKEFVLDVPGDLLLSGKASSRRGPNVIDV